MKRLLLLLIVFLEFSHGMAQEASFGFKVGANYSTIFGDFTDGYQPRLGFQAGAFIVIEMNDKFYFQPEVFYANQGFILDTDLPSSGPDTQNSNIKINTQQNYLSIPLLVGFPLNDKLALEVGPQLAFLLNQVRSVKESGFGDLGAKDKIPGDFRLDYGLVTGVSYRLSDYLLVQPRVYLGIANNLRDNLFSDGAQNRNLSFQLAVGYTFN